jgi:hypothetical protein
MMTKSYVVVDYRTGEVLSGPASLTLIQESLKAGHKGAVGAEYDEDCNVWRSEPHSKTLVYVEEV